jgi:hypothetical protein
LKIKTKLTTWIEEKIVIIGSGTHRYEVADQWGNLPNGLEFGCTHGVVEDSEGRIIVHHMGKECTIVLDPEGNVLDSWGADWHDGAHGMFLNREADGEYLYFAATSRGCMIKTTLSGEEVMRLPAPPRPDIYSTHVPGEEKYYIPTETVVASTGDIYVSDGYGQSWIHRYSAEGEYKDSYGGPGEELGKLNCPHGIMLDTRGKEELLLVSDRSNVRLQYFTLDGEFVRCTDSELRHPCTTDQWKDEIYVPDLHSRITVFDKNDELILHLGDRANCWETEGWPNLPKSDWVEGAFSSPHDLHVDAAGNIYIAEWLSEGTGKITKLIRLKD